jgi:hypothetical protein
MDDCEKLCTKSHSCFISPLLGSDNKIAQLGSQAGKGMGTDYQAMNLKRVPYLACEIIDQLRARLLQHQPLAGFQPFEEGFGVDRLNRRLSGEQVGVTLLYREGRGNPMG